jgi:hypothetical protein
MQTILEMFGPPPSGGDVGIEIEVEGINLPTRPFDIWAVKRDGSLRGEGYEYITKGSVKLDNLYKGIKNLNDRFDKTKAVVNAAHRASVHIHVNAQSRTIYDVFGVLFAWSMAERVWMRLCGKTRESNLFCLPSSQSGHQIQFAKEMLSCVTHESWHNFPLKGKYDALNTDPIMNLGSVEFRTFPSSINPDDICRWAGWCTRLVEYGSKIDRDNLTKEWEKVFENPEEFLETIFKGDERGMVKDETIQLVKQGCEDASDLALVWANHKIDLAKKKLEVKVPNQLDQYAKMMFRAQNVVRRMPRRVPVANFFDDEFNEMRDPE